MTTSLELVSNRPADSLELVSNRPADVDEDSRLLDLEIMDRYAALNPWGMATGIDLGGCDPQRIRDAGCIHRFVVELCDLIQMNRFGDPVILRFGKDPRVSGYSLAQLIETSLISGHFAEESDSAYIDIFSCKAYPPYLAGQFCRDWFGAVTMRVNVAMRDAERVPAV